MDQARAAHSNAAPKASTCSLQTLALALRPIILQLMSHGRVVKVEAAFFSVNVLLQHSCWQEGLWILHFWL